MPTQMNNLNFKGQNIYASVVFLSVRDDYFIFRENLIVLCNHNVI